MRYLLRLLCVCALCLVPVVGCFEMEPFTTACTGVDCDDGNECTRDYCIVVYPAGTCGHELVADGTPCGGGNVCVNGACRENRCADCEDDGNSCTMDCDYETGACDHVPLPDGDRCKDEQNYGRCYGGVCMVCEELDCDDGDLCTDDYCSPDYGCINNPVHCGDGDDCTADLCDPVTGECVHTPTDGNWCFANRELGLGGEYLLGSCESGRCTGQPCDLTSEEVYPCPVRDATSSGEPWICCPWELLPSHPRGYCTTHGNCWTARCAEECPNTEANPSRSADCNSWAGGDCAVVDYCHAECASHYVDYVDCMYQGGVCPSP